MWQQSNSVQVFRSVDMGFWPDPAYCLWLAHLGNRYIAFQEKLWYKTVASQIAEEIKEMSVGMKVSTTFCDPSMDIQTGADVRTIKGIFEDHGVPMDCSVNNREHYAHAVNTALNEEAEPGIPRLQILDTGCPYLIKTIPQMTYNPKRPMALADHKQDHAVVTLAYFLISYGSDSMRTYSNRSNQMRPWMRPKQTDRHLLGSDQVRDKR
jgi:hypothetical protein